MTKRTTKRKAKPAAAPPSPRPELLPELVPLPDPSDPDPPMRGVISRGWPASMRQGAVRSMREFDARDPVATLSKFALAVGEGYYPDPQICRWLAERFREYDRKGEALTLDWLLGLKPAGKGQRPALAQARRKMRDDYYLNQMCLYVAALGSVAQAAKHVIDKSAFLAARWKWPTLSAKHLEEMYGGWKKERWFAGIKAAITETHAEQIAQIREASRKHRK
jgi:hypothetical protein